jgi:hypothetical protein
MRCKKSKHQTSSSFVVISEQHQIALSLQSDVYSIITGLHMKVAGYLYVHREWKGIIELQTNYIPIKTPGD